jgi:hypothetical protein
LLGVGVAPKKVVFWFCFGGAFNAALRACCRCAVLLLT